jgi:hypothetical protein
MVEMVLVEISLTTLATLNTALMDKRGQFSEFWQTLLLEKRKILILEPWNSSSRNEAGRHNQGKGRLKDQTHRCSRSSL